MCDPGNRLPKSGFGFEGYGLSYASLQVGLLLQDCKDLLEELSGCIDCSART